MSTHTAITAPTQFVEANGIRFAYRRWGRRSGLPLVFNHHLNGNLDNWDPAVLDGLAKEREVIIFNNAGVASSTGEVPATFAGMAWNAEAFVDALGLKHIDLLGFSLGGMVAQQITLDRPELIRELILVGTAPRGFDAGNGQGHITPGDGGDLRCQLRPTREPLAQGLLYRFKEESGSWSRSPEALFLTNGEPRLSGQR